MKGIKLFLAVLLAPLAFQAAADDATDIARAATRRGTSGSITTTRPKNTPTPNQTHTGSSRTTGTDTNTHARTSVAVTPRDGTVSTRTASPVTKSVSARTTTKIQPRTIKTASRTTPQPRVSVLSRTPDTSRAATRAPAKTRTDITSTRARTATTLPQTDMLNRDFSKCRTIFYDCMDEFCANKDSQLKRCACSSRIHEFDGTKQNLADIEDKLLDFSQRLLTVNMDKEDAQALYTPTEGELAYATKDTSTSKKMLDEIAKKLNTSFNNSNFDQGLNAISLSLNMDSAFDSVDSMAGASTTAKSGTALYTSALPICREMAQEVCSSSDLAIAESSYQMAIESDCNTVKKSYQTQIDQARQQVFESGALLDISRLDIHQQRNSDNILTCKRKMLDMLTDSTVCGPDMGKCLDITGRYIDPTTGSAFLSTDLTNLSSLISRPESGQTWRSAPGNDRFVTFLNSKKKFLEPAMEKCQDISDYVWDEFIDDALAQIKLAQESKLEEVRQSCTKLTTQCMDDAYDSITEFDARALTIFGIMADKTINAMCAEVKNACTALMKTSDSDTTEWETGISGITNDKTFETIMHNCREVGRACIIQTCTAISGNFGLCENIDTSINRKSIINRTACWDQVLACVDNADDKTLAEISAMDAYKLNTNGNFYDKMYPELDDPNYEVQACTNGNKCVYDICATTHCEDTTSVECYKCRLAERIWGNCEASPQTPLQTGAENKIKISGDTLLAWFAKNTGTADKPNSCRDTSCPPGFLLQNNECVHSSQFDSTNTKCDSGADKITVYDNFTNCCASGTTKDSYGNCAKGLSQQNIKNITIKDYFGEIDQSFGTTSIWIHNASTTPTLMATYEHGAKKHYVICLLTQNQSIDWTPETPTGSADNFPNGTTVTCPGEIIIIDGDGHYWDNNNNNPYHKAQSYYNTTDGTTCVFNPTENTWKTCGGEVCTAPTTDWHISYTPLCQGTTQ